MKQIWILEDDQGQQFIYREILATRYSIRFFDAKGDFFTTLEKDHSSVGLFIIDIMLKDGSIFEGSQLSRLNKTKIPYLMISSIDEIDIMQRSFALGAYDYLTKPFNKNELIVKVERLVNEFLSKNQKLAFRNFRLNSIDMTIESVDQKTSPVRLTPREMQIVGSIFNQRDTTITRKTIMKEVWGKTVVSDKTFDVHMHNLRGKIEPVGIQIQNISFETYKILCSE